MAKWLFPKGYIPWNKGLKKQLNTGKTHFKKGYIPWNQNKKGYKLHSEESKRKTSKALKGIKRKPFSKEHKRKLSESHIGIQAKERNPNWKGGITPEKIRIRKGLESKLWKKAVLERDNFICQKCNQKGGYLIVHHIFNFTDFPEVRFAIDNGITLCKICHLEFHNKYGRHNNTKEQLLQFLNLR